MFLSELPEETSLYGVLVVLARAGWYSSFRMDHKESLRGHDSVGLWLSCPYWLGMPTASVSKTVGWFSSLMDDHPGEIGVRCPGILRLRPRLIHLWNTGIRALPATFTDSVPEQDGRGGFRPCAHASRYLPDWQPGGSRHYRRFSPAPVNLPEITEEWIAGRSVTGKPWEFENPVAGLLGFPALLRRIAAERADAFDPAWDMVNFELSAMNDYGRQNEETWKWTASNYVVRFQTPRGNVGMNAGLNLGVEAPVGDEAWNETLRLLADQSLDLQSDVYENGPQGEKPVFRYRETRGKANG